jgi:glucose-1-phosphate cytidylyltransferase
MVEIGGMPILWHIMKCFSSHEIRDFVICCGYKGYLIKEYFSNYFLHMSDVTIDMESNEIRVHQKMAEPWKVTLIDTGEHTLTGGRLKRVADYVSDEDLFCFTYGDGLADINLTAEIEFHRTHGKLATVCAVKPPGRYGALEIEDGNVTGFMEKPPGGGGLINGGYFVLSPKCIELIEGDQSSWEGNALAKLSDMNELIAFEHDGFWQPMDTLRERNHLEELWSSGKAPWKIW